MAPAGDPVPYGVSGRGSIGHGPGLLNVPDLAYSGQRVDHRSWRCAVNKGHGERLSSYVPKPASLR